jgi:ketosteroid isomerase-like protein
MTTIVSPEELLDQVTELINSKDINSLIHLYETEASFVEQSGKLINGRENIRLKLLEFLEMNGKLRTSIRKSIQSGNIALIYSDWTFTGSSSDGPSIDLCGTSVNIVRKQSDNSWQIVIDDPWAIVQT